MSTHASSLPETWVERIWVEMRATYGASFDRQWQCPPGIDPVQHVADLKAVWARELSPLQRNPKAIAHALANLPERPPNLVEFRRLCARAPETVEPALPAPKADPQRIREAFTRMRQITRQARPDGKAWARALKEREEAGEILNPAQRAMWRTALRAPVQTEEPCS